MYRSMCFIKSGISTDTTVPFKSNAMQTIKSAF